MSTNNYMKLGLLCFLILYPLFCFPQLDSLKGKVRSVKDSVTYMDRSKGITLYHREMDFGQYSLTEESIFHEFRKGTLYSRWPAVKKTQREYDKEGYLTRIISADNANSFTTIHDYLYDEYKNRIQEKTTSLAKDYESIEVTNYRYYLFKDSTDRVMTEVSYNSDPDWFKMKQYFYTEKAQLIEERELWGFGWDRKINYKYDPSGRLLSEIYSDIKRVLKYDNDIGSEAYQDSAAEIYHVDFSYYPDGSLKERIQGCSAGFVTSACQKTVYTYDGQKRKSKIYFYWMGNDSLFSHREYEYNADNTIKKIAWFFKTDTKSRNSVEYFYTSKDLTKVIFTDVDSASVIEFKYQYDSRNNWTEQKKIVNNELLYTRNREIIYWD